MNPEDYQVIRAIEALRSERAERKNEFVAYIVARDRPELYERLRGNFVNEPDAQVILDRRCGRRRQRPETRSPERRKADRRSRSLVDANLRSLGWAVVRTM
jgi:hypothetical protein